MNKIILYLTTLISFAIAHPKMMATIGIAGVSVEAHSQYIVGQLGNGDTVHINIIGGSRLWSFDSSILNKNTRDSLATKLCIRNILNPDWSAVSGTGQILNKPTIPVLNYSNYEAIVTQSGTSAPSGVRKDANFGATTFTWARSSAGVYTLTANAATFTAGKTVVVISPQTNPFNQVAYAVTSSTVITFTTITYSVITLIFSSTNTDSILNNTLVDVRVYN